MAPVLAIIVVSSVYSVLFLCFHFVSGIYLYFVNISDHAVYKIYLGELSVSSTGLAQYLHQQVGPGIQV